MIFITYVVKRYSLRFGLDRTHCPIPSAAQDDRIASFPFSPSILSTESNPYTAWAHITGSSPLPENSILSVELVNNKSEAIENGLSLIKHKSVSVVGTKFDINGSARTEKFGVRKTSCDVYGRCEIKDFKDHDHALFHFRFSVKMNNEEVYSYYSPGNWLFSKVPARKKLQYFIDAQKSLRRTTCYFDDISTRIFQISGSNNSERLPRYTIRVYFPGINSFHNFFFVGECVSLAAAYSL
eukprot:TRINITY_DN3840_c0_g1_i6.p1 TRINITY_DN3840_c0_g1~~TRINITY_DN3840_c0_g1_i6.p1  ORF type:complete len:239 (-),score=30.47 TRINITY_DN3840_c0_g1_i6:1271-1987(-)